MNNAIYNHDCPALMSDGRIVTDYEQSCSLNNRIQNQNGITNAYDYKLFLQQNGMQVQRQIRDFYNQKNSCTSCGGYYIADPSNQIDYWNQYANWIHYGNGQSGVESGPGCPINEAFVGLRH